MFREIILHIFRSTRLCVTACGIMHPRCCRPKAGNIVGAFYHTRSSAPEDEQNSCPKHVGLTGIINKPLLLHLVGCLYYLYQWCTVKQLSDNEIYLLIKYIKSVLWRLAKCLSYIEDAWCLKAKHDDTHTHTHTQVHQAVGVSLQFHLPLTATLDGSWLRFTQHVL